MVNTESSSRIGSVLLQKFEALHEAFIDLNSEAGNYHREIAATNKTSRARFEALSRTLAFCDQIHLVLTIMREDIRGLDPTMASTIMAPWNDQLDEALEEWLRSACLANSTIH